MACQGRDLGMLDLGALVSMVCTEENENRGWYDTQELGLMHACFLIQEEV